MLCLFLCQIHPSLAYKRRVSVDDLGEALEENITHLVTSPGKRTVLNGAQALAWFKANKPAKVISAAGKIVLNVPKKKLRRGVTVPRRGGRGGVLFSRPLFKYSTRKARKPQMLTDWQNKPARAAKLGGLIWQSGPDKKDQGVATDGEGIIIFKWTTVESAFEIGLYAMLKRVVVERFRRSFES